MIEAKGRERVNKREMGEKIKRGKERERTDRSRNLDTLKPALGLY